MKLYLKPVLLSEIGDGSLVGEASQLIGGGDDEEEGTRRLMKAASDATVQNVNEAVEVFSIDVPSVEPEPEIIEPVQVDMIDLESLGDLGEAN